MHGSFNTTFDVYAGPNSDTPGEFKGTFAGRLVRENAIAIVGPDAPSRGWYLTTPSDEIVGAWTPEGFGMDARLADQVAIPSGSEPAYWVLFVEDILWGSQALYYRANLISLPLPEVEAVDVGPHVPHGSAVGLVLGCETSPMHPILIGVEIPSEGRFKVGCNTLASAGYGYSLRFGRRDETYGGISFGCPADVPEDTEIVGGGNCGSATPMELGVHYVIEVVSDESQWFLLPVPGLAWPGTYSAVVSGMPGDFGDELDFWQGPCGEQALLIPINSDGVWDPIEVNFLGGDHIYVQVLCHTTFTLRIIVND